MAEHRQQDEAGLTVTETAQPARSVGEGHAMTFRQAVTGENAKWDLFSYSFMATVLSYSFVGQKVTGLFAGLTVYALLNLLMSAHATYRKEKQPTIPQ